MASKKSLETPDSVPVSALAERVAQELVRALRGRRSRIELSRRLGYRSNIVRRWEAGECFPVAADFLNACVRIRPQVASIFVRFFQRAPEWWDTRAGFTREALAAFLRDLRGRTPVGSIAARSGYNRYTVGRWFSGLAEPRLPEFLTLIEVCSRRMLDFVAGIVEPAHLPSLAADWQRLQAAREAAYEVPWSHAVLRALELDCPRGGRTALWLAKRLGISLAQVLAGLDVLKRSGQVRQVGRAYLVDEVIHVDTSGDPERARSLKIAWAEVALERLRSGHRGSFGYSLFAISKRDLRRLRELHLEYVRAMQNVIAESTPGECVGLYNAQLMDLATAQNALE
ncbi:MAG: hypothetical protein B6A08_13615 [Sorangiineae bacterium NIC37A_2]|nr:MAG: hypothetical protein B6A08_13615 [Sorangiineae bacterium NIC37A_2]